MLKKNTLLWILGATVALGAVYVWLMQPSVPSTPKADQVDFLSITREIDDIRKQIAANAKQAKNTKRAGIGVSYKVAGDAGKIRRVWVDEDGVILVRASDFGTGHDDALFLLIPQLSSSDGSIGWVCVGYPRDAVPNNCR